MIVDASDAIKSRKRGAIVRACVCVRVCVRARERESVCACEIYRFVAKRELVLLARGEEEIDDSRLFQHSQRFTIAETR